MRIVIVDGDPGLAEELRVALAGYALDWTVATIPHPGEDEGGEAVDVLVSGLSDDPRWRAELTALRARHPGAVRVLLLEPGQDADALSYFDGAHRVLRRPMDPDELIDAVEGIEDLRELLDSPQLKQYVGGIERLPAAPRMYMHLTRLMADGDVALARVADELSQDPAIVAQVLRLCNSAYFSSGREITDIRTAVTRLGLQTIRQLVLGSEAYGRADGLSSTERDAIQDRALRISRLAGRLLPGSSFELATTAGLLVEVGRLLPPPQDPALAADPAEAGAYLLGLWGLPMPIVEAVAFHRQPRRRRVTGFWVTGALHVAAALVNDLEVDEGYLRSVGMIDRLPQWRVLMEQDAARAAA